VQRERELSEVGSSRDFLCNRANGFALRFVRDADRGEAEADFDRATGNTLTPAEDRDRSAKPKALIVSIPYVLTIHESLKRPAEGMGVTAIVQRIHAQNPVFGSENPVTRGTVGLGTEAS
jgi:hypothetical protein